MFIFVGFLNISQCRGMSLQMRRKEPFLFILLLVVFSSLWTFSHQSDQPYNLWQPRWDIVMTSAKMVEMMCRVVRPWPWRDLEPQSEMVMTHLRTILTRHTHSYRMSWVVQAYCDDCLVPLIVWYLLVESQILGELCKRNLSCCPGKDGSICLFLILWYKCFFPGLEVYALMEKDSFLYLIKNLICMILPFWLLFYIFSVVWYFYSYFINLDI